MAETPHTRPGRHIHLLPLALLFAATLLPHLPALSAGFTSDDRDFVQQNASIRSFSVDQLWSAFPPGQPGRGLYRPLTAFSYTLDHLLSGDRPAGYHATSLLYYLLTVVLVYLLCCRYLGSTRAGLAAALLFALHPVHSEAVDSIAGRSELLALLFSLASILALLRLADTSTARRRAAWLALSVLCYGLAALSKETAVVGLPALLAVHLFLGYLGGGGPSPARRYLWLLPHLLLLPCYLALRLVALQGSMGPTKTVLHDASFIARLHAIGDVFFEYTRLLLAPTTLQVDAYYERVVATQATLSARSMAGLALLALTVALLVLLVRRARREVLSDASTARHGAATTVALGLAAFLLFLLPVLHLVPIGAVMAERFLFAPSFGFVLALSAALRRPLAGLVRGRPPRAVALGAGLGLILVLLGLRGYLRAREWRDAVTLWSVVERSLKDDYRIYNNLAIGHIERGELAVAAQMLRRSLALKPDHPRALHNLGHLYLRGGHYLEARRVLLDLVRAHPRHHMAWNSLGVIEVRRHNPARARSYFRRALAINPNYHTARKNLAGIERAPRHAAP